MSLLTAQANFKKAFIDEDSCLTDKFIKQIKKYVSQRKDVARHADIYQCLEEGKPLAAFSCRNDLCDELVLEMLQREIPFVLVCNRKGDYGFIICSTDRALANEALKAVLKKQGVYCGIVTGDELITIVQKIKSNDKGLIAINGMSFEELKMLEKLCRRKGFLEHIAEDKMSNGKYRFMVYGRQALTEQNFPAILFELAMMLEGPNSKIYKNRIEKELRVKDLINHDFKRAQGIEKPIYIVGNNNQYMKIEQNSFEYGNAIKHKDGIEFLVKYTGDKDSPGFHTQENNYFSRITDPSYTTDYNEVIKHFERNNTRDSLDFGMNPAEKNRYFGEKILISSVLSVVFRNAIHDDIMNVSERWMEKTSHLTFEAGKVLNGLIYDEVPTGYSKIDMKEIMPVISEYGMELKNYRGVADLMKGMQITNERGSLEISGNLEERIEGFHEKVISGQTTEKTEEMEISESEYSHSSI